MGSQAPPIEGAFFMARYEPYTFEYDTHDHSGITSPAIAVFRVNHSCIWAVNDVTFQHLWHGHRSLQVLVLPLFQ